MTAAPLVVQGLGFSYADRHVFADWSHRFAPGLTWVQGPNGCGKSTLLKLLGGALEPFAGRRTVEGVEARADPLGYRRRVFWCSPDPVAFGHLKPDEYFAFLAGLYPTLDRAALPPLLAALGLELHLHKRLDMLSTGTGRKVAVAAALVAGTPVTLLDEPLAGVDRRSMPVVAQALIDLACEPGRAVVVTSHEDLGTAAAAADVLELKPLP